MRLGLAGAHRVGKTTAAKTFSQEVDLPFVQTDATGVITNLGFKPCNTFTFEQRLEIQSAILAHHIEVWEEAGPRFITDRTPIDFLMYTYSEVPKDLSQSLQKNLEEYREVCFVACSLYFDAIVVIQPGIPLVHAEGKAIINAAFIDQLTLFAKGLCSEASESVNLLTYKMPRNTVLLKDRMSFLRNIYNDFCFM